MANTTKSVISVTEHFHVINLKLTESQAVTNIINRREKKKKKKTQIMNVCFVLYDVNTYARLCVSENIYMSFSLNKQ